MTRRYNRRSTRPLDELPSLFGAEEAEQAEATFEVVTARPSAAADTSSAAGEFGVGAEFRRPVERLRFMSMGSGSSGNCAYVGTRDAGILVDAGVDNNKVTDALRRNGISMESLKGIFLTHDHADHVKFAYSLLRRNPHMRLYCTNRVLEGLLRRHNISRRIKDYHAPIFKEHEYAIGAMNIVPFETSHDGTDNCGYSIALGDMTFVIATDMGVVTERADFYIRRARALMIESNYDSDMLTNGRYTEHLKARIRSERGHMDNVATARYLTDIYTPALRHIFLCHLSEDNNTPAMAMATVTSELRRAGVTPAISAVDIPDHTAYIIPLPRFDVTELYVF